MLPFTQFLLQKRSININTKSTRKEGKQKMNLAEKKRRKTKQEVKRKNDNMNQKRGL
jgi:hypothetical protein